MTFGEYVRALRCISAEENNPDTAIALLNIATNKVLDIPRSDKERSNIISYIRAGRNIPEKFAKEVKDFYNSKCLRSYLTNTCPNYERKRLCEAFRDYCPEINNKNAINHAIRLFEEMLDSAGGEKNQASPHKKKRKLSKTDLKDIQAIITQLHCTVEKLIENSIRIHMHQTFDTEADSCYRDEFNRNHETFLNLNMELHNYVVIYPGLAIIDTIFELSRTIDFTLKTACQKSGCHINYDDKIDEYKQCLDQLLKMLHEM